MNKSKRVRRERARVIRAEAEIFPTRKRSRPNTRVIVIVPSTNPLSRNFFSRRSISSLLLLHCLLQRRISPIHPARFTTSSVFPPPPETYLATSFTQNSCGWFYYSATPSSRLVGSSARVANYSLALPSSTSWLSFFFAFSSSVNPIDLTVLPFYTLL